jgi:hypothetical protein
LYLGDKLVILDTTILFYREDVMENVLSTVWSLLNTPVGISIIAGVFLWALNKLYTAKPGWAAYEGSIISAIKFAEKVVPNDTKNKGLSKLDVALRYVLRVHEEATGKKASAKLAASIKEGIQLKHDLLDDKGTLKNHPPEVMHTPKDPKKGEKK